MPAMVLGLRRKPVATYSSASGPLRDTGDSMADLDEIKSELQNVFGAINALHVTQLDTNRLLKRILSLLESLTRRIN